MRALLLAVAASLARPSAAVHPLPPHRLFAIFNGRSDAFPGYLAGRAPWLKQKKLGCAGRSVSNPAHTYFQSQKRKQFFILSSVFR